MSEPIQPGDMFLQYSDRGHRLFIILGLRDNNTWGMYFLDSGRASWEWEHHLLNPGYYKRLA